MLIADQSFSKVVHSLTAWDMEFIALGRCLFLTHVVIFSSMKILSRNQLGIIIIFTENPK